MKYKIKHKTEGWTGTIELDDLDSLWFSSHRCGGNITYTIEQDSHDPNGKYVEDPDVNSLSELEFLEEIK